MRDPEARHITRDDAEALVAALNARDFAAMERLWFWHAEVEFRSALAVAEGDTYRGIDGIREWAQAVDETWIDFRVEVTDFQEVSDQFVVIYRATGRARASGIPLDTRVGQVWTMRDGRLWRNIAFTDPREAFAAVGLSE